MMRISRTHGIAATAIALCMALGLAGCTIGGQTNSSDSTADQQTTENGSADSSTSKFLDADGIQKEYASTLESLEFPDGYTPPATMDTSGATQFEQGSGESSASFIWMCAWEEDWLNSYATNEQEASSALQQLNKAKDMPFMQSDRVDEPTRDMLQSRLDKAAMSDPSGIQQDVDLNCSAQ
ncbi:hypothetical protein [Bifidobacterium lemurum]|nr:hypothetical protein [Bifidobacterium lemurum]QOL33611.1 hypothetical protein BL8807_07365 [Bifidobacterium lemurum]